MPKRYPGLITSQEFDQPGMMGKRNRRLETDGLTLSEYLSLSIANVKLSESLSRQSILDAQTGCITAFHGRIVAA